MEFSHCFHVVMLCFYRDSVDPGVSGCTKKNSLKEDKIDGVALKLHPEFIQGKNM